MRVTARRVTDSSLTWPGSKGEWNQQYGYGIPELYHAMQDVNATGIPASTESTVDAAACATVNPANCQVSASASVCANPVPSPRRRIAATGQAKNTIRKPSGARQAAKGTRNPIRPDGLVSDCGRRRRRRDP